MGYDKPDLGFVVHFQAPSSAIAYYQQVGRAGRGVAEAHVVLLRGHEDRAIQDFFIETAFPPQGARRGRARASSAVERAPVDDPGAAGRRQPRPRRASRRMLKVLDVEGAVRREGSGWVRTGAPWAYDERALRRGHRDAPRRAGGDVRLRRGRALPHAGAAERARRPARRAVRPLRGLHRSRASTRRSTPGWRARPTRSCARGRSCSAVRRQTPRTADQAGQEDRAGAPARGGPRARARRRRRLGRARAAGPPRRPLRRRARAGVRRPARPLAPGPARRDGSPPCRRAARARSCPTSRRGSPTRSACRTSTLLERVGRQPAAARDGQLGAAGRERPRRSSASPPTPPAGPGLLVDDVRYSGWTLATIGAQLRMKGAGPVHPAGPVARRRLRPQRRRRSPSAGRVACRACSLLPLSRAAPRTA